MNRNATWDLKDRICIVTGANAGLGLVTAEAFAKLRAHVFLACRSRSRTEPVVNGIRRQTENDKVEFLPLDLASFASIRACAQRFLERDLQLHVLVNNAGLSGRGGVTQDGFELVFGTNYLGHFLLTSLLLDKLLESAPSRIVNVSSLSHRKLTTVDWSVAREPTPPFKWPHPTYPVSKLANILFTRELARRLEGTGVTSYAVHPGVVATEIWRMLPWPLRTLLKLPMKSPEAGARTQIYCAVAPELHDRSGRFYANCKPYPPSPLARDDALAEELWRLSEQWCGIASPATQPDKVNGQGN